MQPQRPAFLYDADCGACTRFKSLVSFMDAKHAVNFVSIQEAGRSGILDRIPPSLWYSAARNLAKDGTITSGGDALLALMSELPGGRLPSMAVGRFPGGVTSARRFYGVLSRVHGTTCSFEPDRLVGGTPR